MEKYCSINKINCAGYKCKGDKNTCISIENCRYQKDSITYGDIIRKMDNKELSKLICGEHPISRIIKNVVNANPLEKSSNSTLKLLNSYVKDTNTHKRERTKYISRQIFLETPKRKQRELLNKIFDQKDEYGVVINSKDEMVFYKDAKGSKDIFPYLTENTMRNFIEHLLSCCIEVKEYTKGEFIFSIITRQNNKVDTTKIPVMANELINAYWVLLVFVIESKIEEEEIKKREEVSIVKEPTKKLASIWVSLDGENL